MTPEALAQELAQTAALLQDAGAGETALLRPPGGLVSDEVRCQAAQAGLSLIFWNVDPEDWRGGPAQATAQHVISHVAPGAIVLLHDLQETSVTAAGQIIDALQAQGYQFLTVSQLAAYYGKALTPGESYRAFSPPEPHAARRDNFRAFARFFLQCGGESAIIILATAAILRRYRTICATTEHRRQ